VLICDDFAMREFTAAQADDLYELLTERIGRPGRSLILTSNRSPADWYPLFPNAVVGESILDRVLNTSHHLLLEGKSYRPRRRPGQGRPAPAAPRPP
jgi:DNA replication protein DnaC